MPQLVIPQFDPPWECFSNFEPSVLIINGYVYQTVEHAYQTLAKTLNPVEQEWVRSAPTPKQAKRRGKKVTLRDDHVIVKIPFMKSFVLMKFMMYPQYRKVLIASGDALIQEGNWWGDTFWGIYRGEGANNLGLILMEVRDLLKLMR